MQNSNIVKHPSILFYGLINRKGLELHSVFSLVLTELRFFPFIRYVTEIQSAELIKNRAEEIVLRDLIYA